MKTVLAVWHGAGKGKSSTLREFANLLLATYPKYIAIEPIPASVPVSGDFRLVIKIKGKIIGIESKGDPSTKLKARLLELADKYKCDVIICTTRTRGSTVTAVDNLYHNRGFETIWTSTYQFAGATQQKQANKLKAKHILDLLNSFSII